MQNENQVALTHPDTAMHTRRPVRPTSGMHLPLPQGRSESRTVLLLLLLSSPAAAAAAAAAAADLLLRSLSSSLYSSSP